MPKSIERCSSAAWLRATAVALWLGTAAGARAQEAPAPPSAELLEFLGSFETADGEWFDPGLLTDVQSIGVNDVPAATTTAPAASINDDLNKPAHENAREEQ